MPLPTKRTPLLGLTSPRFQRTDEENSDDDTDECSSYAGGTGVCTEGPEYEEMCRQIWEDMQDGKIETGGYTDEGSEAVDRYSRNSCDQR